MRLLSLNPNGNEETALDFHPAVTVVNGLGLLGRQQVLHALTALAKGRDPGIGGLVEAHGVMLDLSPATLAMLDLEGVDLDVLVSPHDLPGAGPAAAAPAAADRPAVAPTGRLTVEQFLAVTPAGRYPELDDARGRRADAAEALELLRDAAVRTKTAHEEARVRRERAEAAVERARAELAGEVVARPATSSVDAAAIAERRSELDGELARLRDELARIDRALDELSAIDTRPIQVLLDAIRDPVPIELVPSERANELADEYVRLQAEVAVLEQRLEARGFGPQSAMARLERARAELADAERGMAKPELSETDIAELEAAHELVLEAEKKASGFGKRGQKRLEEALAAEQAILDRVGYPTWSAYIMGSSLLSVDPLAERRLEQARDDVEAAEAHWAEITALIEADAEHRALIDDLEAVYLEAYDLLGGEEPDDIEGALRDLKVARREVTTEELVDALAYQLELVGLSLPPDMVGVDYAVVVADAFLTEAAGINDRASELRDERRRNEADLAAAEREVQSLAAVDPDTIDLTDDALVDELEEDEELDIAELHEALVRAAEDEADYAEALEAREALVDAATQVEAVAASRLMKLAGELAERAGELAESALASESALEEASEEAAADTGAETVEFYLLARLAALRNISYAGSVPMVLDDALQGLDPEDVRHLLGKLERMAESVQVVYLGDDPTVVDWALEMGFERAAVVTAPAPFA